MNDTADSPNLTAGHYTWDLPSGGSAGFLTMHATIQAGRVTEWYSVSGDKKRVVWTKPETLDTWGENYAHALRAEIDHRLRLAHLGLSLPVVEFVAEAQQLRAVGGHAPTLNTIPVTPHPEAVIRADGGRCGVLVVRRLGVRLTGHTRSWTWPLTIQADCTDAEWAAFNQHARLVLGATRPMLCDCTDGGRDNPLRGCPGCGGTGEVK